VRSGERRTSFVENTPEPETDVGALARIGSDQVLTGLRLARTGRVYDLGLEINEQMPQGPRGFFVPFSRAFSATPEGTGGHAPFTFAAEVVIGTQHTSTHIDGLMHVQSEGRAYGGARVCEVRADQGFSRNGMETVPPIVSRAVLLDIAALKGAEALADGYEITITDLESACEAAAVEIGTGDVVLVRTGKIREFFADPVSYEASQPGIGPAAAVWLYERGMAALATDTTGTEAVPYPNLPLTTHGAMLVERGVHLIENVFLDELARDKVVESTFVCLPLKITGASGSWVRPIAIA
jgi:kynurenine formamidase